MANDEPESPFDENEANAVWATLWEDADDKDELVLACERWRRAAHGERHSFRYRLRGIINKRTANWKHLTNAIRSGVPPSLRANVWWYCSGGLTKRRQDKRSYADILTAGNDAAMQGSEAARAIAIDVERTGVDDESLLVPLENVLRAFAIKNPEIGYCQSMNFIAAMLLQYVEEEHAFWILCSIVEDLLPQGYYSPSLHGVRADLKVFDALTEQFLPGLYKHMSQNNIDLSPIAMNWFLCLFVNTLPAEHSCRFMDCLLHEGSKMLFRAGLSLLKLRQAELMRTTSITEAYMLLRSPFGGGESFRELNFTEVSPDEFMRLVHGSWGLLGLKSEAVTKLRAAKLEAVQTEDAEVAARREALRKKQQVVIPEPVSGQLESLDDFLECPVDRLNKSFAELQDSQPRRSFVKVKSDGAERRPSSSWVSFVQTGDRTNGICDDWSELSEASSDENAPTGSTPAGAVAADVALETMPVEGYTGGRLGEFTAERA